MDSEKYDPGVRILPPSQEVDGVMNDSQEGADLLDSIASALDDEYPLDRLGGFPEYQLLMVDNQPSKNEKLRRLMDSFSALIDYKLRQRMKEQEDAGVPTNEGLKQVLMGIDGNPAAKEVTYFEGRPQVSDGAPSTDKYSTTEGVASTQWVNERIAQEKTAIINHMVRLVAAVICILVLVFTYYHR